MQKVYIAASQMMGKSVFWSLLDGHPNLNVNLTHIPTGIFLLNKELRKIISNRLRSTSKRLEDEHLNTLVITYPDKSKIEMNIGDFFRMMYQFGGYGALYFWSKNNKIMINNKELNCEFSKFYFNINKYEDLIFKKFFYKKQTKLNVEDVITILQQSYCKCRRYKKSRSKVFIESLGTEKEEIKNIYEGIKDSKIICLRRDPIAMCYSTVQRTLLKKNQFITSSLQKKIFFKILRKYHLEDLFIIASQGNFYRKKIINYNIEIKEYKNNSRVIFVDFNDLILKTEDTMLSVSKFLNINYNKILTTPTIEGKLLKKTRPVIGKINDDYLSKLNKKEINILKNIFSKITKNSLIYYKLFLYFTFFFLILKSFLFNKK